MVFETTTSLSPADVFARAKRFFAERVPSTAAFPEKEGPGWLVLRGQGGEEVALAAVAGDGATRVRTATGDPTVGPARLQAVRHVAGPDLVCFAKGKGEARQASSIQSARTRTK